MNQWIVELINGISEEHIRLLTLVIESVGKLCLKAAPYVTKWWRKRSIKQDKKLLRTLLNILD